MEISAIPSPVRRRSRRALLPVALALFSALAVVFPASSLAVPYFPPPPVMYWTGGGSDGLIGQGELVGEGVFGPRPLYSGEHSPVGLTLDPSSNRIYWTGQSDDGVGTVRTGALDGSGPASTLYETPDDGSLALGIGIRNAQYSDGGQLFWAQQPSGGGDWSVWGGDTDGSEHAEFAPISGGPANALVVDPEGQSLFWSNGGAIEIGDRINPGSHSVFRATSGEARAVAFVRFSTVYWVAAEGDDLTVYTGTIGDSNIEPLYEEEDSAPLGGLVVIGDRLFWTTDNGAGAGTIMTGKTSGTGSPEVFEPALGAHFLALLTPASPIAAPEITGGGKVGQQLTCAGDQWASDRPSQSYFTAPNVVKYEWWRGTIPVASGKTFTPSEVGFYSCRAIGSNAAGGEWIWSDDFRVLPAPNCHDTSLATIAGAGVAASLPCSGVDPLTYSILSGPQHGKLTSFDAGTGSFTYEPNAGFTGVDSFTFRAAESDAESKPATATIRVSPAQRSADKLTPPPPSNRFRVMAPRVNANSGTAQLRLQVPGPGVLSLRGKRVRAARVDVDSAGVATLAVRPKPAARRQLVSRGRARVKVVVRFAPDGGSPRTLARAVMLRLN